MEPACGNMLYLCLYATVCPGVVVPLVLHRHLSLMCEMLKVAHNSYSLWSNSYLHLAAVVSLLSLRYSHPSAGHLARPSIWWLVLMMDEAGENSPPALHVCSILCTPAPAPFIYGDVSSDKTVMCATPLGVPHFRP